MASSAFTLKDIVTIAALFFGPSLAVIFTLWSQRRANRRAAKQRLFQTLMANRKRWSPPIEWVNALNLIDVIYSDDGDVVDIWQRLYDVLCTHPPNPERFAHAHIELLSAMAHSLGYRYLQQTDIDKFYVPSVFAEQTALANQVITEFLRVLKAIPNPPSGASG